VVAVEGQAASSARPLGQTGRSARARWREWEGALFVVPWLIGFLAFNFGPLLASLAISVTDWSLTDPPEMVGLANYTRLLEDELYLKSLFNTAYYIALHVPLQILLAFGVAGLLNRKVKGLPVFRTFFYLPAVTSGAATAIIWLWLFQPQGLLNQALGLVGVPGPNWLGSTTWAMPSLILMSLWNIGTPMVLFLAGLQGVPQTLYEAAEIDGAGQWGKVRNVTIPMMTPYIFLTAVLGIINSFQVFTSALLVTQGGPANATVFVVLYLFWNGWSYYKMGYASAMAWVLLVMILIATAAQFAISKRWVYYEAGERK
jgi:multiple sugar transport system permease protein